MAHARIDSLTQVSALAADGLAASDIARRTGLTIHQVIAQAAREGTTIRKLTTQERAQRARAACVSAAPHRAVAVPDWVHRSLRGEYRELAAAMGEDWAARQVRRLMAEMRGDGAP